ncbi:hypothetical protein GBAR_LOCUS26677 [Geodia barretti]|uniref:Uncharacterized protein n=1 Tax=Geodia barretti TaxID=519541 RepID=A0AA35TIS2_GEOBA|nr:hypothetical protein GBAR_LOCUS26677 [Geodia barretti]
MASTQQKKKSLYLQRQIERREKFLQSQGAAQEPKHNVQIAPEVVNPPLRQTGHPSHKNRLTKKTGPQQSHLSQEKTLNPDNLQGVGVLLPCVSEKLPKPKAPQGGVGALVSNDRVKKNGALQGPQVSSSVQEEGKGVPALGLSLSYVTNAATGYNKKNPDDNDTTTKTQGQLAKKATQPRCSPKLGAQPGEKVSSPIQEEGRGEQVFGLTLPNTTNTATLCNKSLLSPTSGKLDVNHQQKITEAKRTTQPHSSQKLGAPQGEQVSSPIQEEGEGHQASGFPLPHSMQTKPGDKNHGKNSKALSSSSPVNDMEPRPTSLQPCIKIFKEFKEMDSNSPSHSPPEESQFSTLL